MPLEKRTATIPLAAGLQSKVDPRALQPPDLAICRNVQFDEVGGLQTRKPNEEMSLDIVGGGTISASDLRKFSVNGDELLLWTRTSLYSWSARDDGWVLRQAYPAPALTEKSVFARADDQTFAERAELSGVALVTWTELGSATTVWVAAQDTETGAVLLSPTQVAPAGETPTRPHVVAQTTRFLFTYFDSTATIVRAFAIDPSNLATSLAAGVAAPTALGAVGMSGVHDVAVASSGVAYVAANTSGAAYQIIRITDALGAVTNVGKARTGSRLAVAVAPGTTEVNVIRYNGTTIRSDRLNPTTLADVSVDVSLGTPLDATVNQITAAYRSVADSGQFRCYAFWSCGESSSDGTLASTHATESNYVDTGGGTATKVRISRRLGLASRAFDYDGRVYAWLTFAGESDASGMSVALNFRAALQNCYLLYRDSSSNDNASPFARAVADRAGGFGALAGHVGTVQALSATEFAWAGVARRIIPLGADQTGYQGRGVRVVRLEMDSDAARRTARLGRTLYISGGLVSQYDGVGLTEVGFLIAPWAFQTVTLAGNLPAGSYNHKWSLSWTNDAQEKERSTTVAAGASTIAINQLIQFAGPPTLAATHKKNARHAPALECWRTQINPVTGAPFQLVTSLDPSSLSNPNRYIANDPSAALAPTFNDDMVDADLAKQESYYENGAVLANLPPATASIVVATQDRLILAGLADDPNRIAYSKLRGVDEVAAFNGNLTFDLPPDGGPITAVAFQAETMVVWKETATYAVPGDGFDNLGRGQNIGPARLLASDVGAVSQEAVALTPRGLLWKSDKGWYLMGPGWRLEYIGGPVAFADDDEVRSIVVMESQHQVRIVTSVRVLVWDYETNAERGGAWSEWLYEGGRSAVVWRGLPLLIAEPVAGADLAVLAETDFDGSVEAGGMDVETAPIKLADLQGQQKVWRILILGEYRGPAFRLRIRLKKNHETTYFDDKYWTVTPTTVGGPLQVRHSPSVTEMQALAVRITANHLTTDDELAPGEALKLTGIAIEYGVRPGVFRRLALAQTQ